MKQPIVEILDIPNQDHGSLQSSVAYFIKDGAWCIPASLANHFPNLSAEISSISIPLFDAQDYLILTGSESGNLSLKDAYSFLSPASAMVPWSKLIWNSFVPLSRS